MSLDEKFYKWFKSLEIKKSEPQKLRKVRKLMWKNEGYAC